MSIIDIISESKQSELTLLPPTSEWKSFRYEELFNIQKGRGPTANEAKKNPGDVPYIGASAENNGVTAHTSIAPTSMAPAITVSNNGSIGESFFQDLDFHASSDVSVLRIKDGELNSQVGLFLTTLIKAERFKYNYGRKWNMARMKDSIIKVPVNSEGKIDIELITKYMNSLPYSKYI